MSSRKHQAASDTTTPSAAASRITLASSFGEGGGAAAAGEAASATAARFELPRLFWQAATQDHRAATLRAVRSPLVTRSGRYWRLTHFGGGTSVALRSLFAPECG